MKYQETMINAYGAFAMVFQTPQIAVIHTDKDSTPHAAIPALVKEATASPTVPLLHASTFS